MTDDNEGGYRSRLVLAYVESLAPALTDQETASVKRLPGDLRTTLAWVMLRRGTLMAAPPIAEPRPQRARQLLIAAVLTTLLLMIPRGL